MHSSLCVKFISFNFCVWNFSNSLWNSLFDLIGFSSQINSLCLNLVHIWFLSQLSIIFFAIYVNPTDLWILILFNIQFHFFQSLWSSFLLRKCCKNECHLKFCGNFFWSGFSSVPLYFNLAKGFSSSSYTLHAWIQYSINEMSNSNSNYNIHSSKMCVLGVLHKFEVLHCQKCYFWWETGNWKSIIFALRLHLIV